MSAHKNHQDPEFKHLREVVKWLHDYKCFICNKSLVQLEVHHIDKCSTNHELINLIPVCKECHIYLGKVVTLPKLTKPHIAILLEMKRNLYK